MPFGTKGDKKHQHDGKFDRTPDKEKEKETLRRRHWSIKCHEALVFRNHEGNFCLNIEGGAEDGYFPMIGDIKQEKIKYHSGKVYPGELILEINKKRIPGMIRRDVISLIRRSTEPLSLVTVKQSECQPPYDECAVWLNWQSF